MADTGNYRKDLEAKLRALMDRLPAPVADKVYEIYLDPEVQAEMKRLADEDRPSVIAAEKQLLALGPVIKTDDAKRVIGRLAKHIMTDRLGYLPHRAGVRIPEPALFTKGTTYRLPGTAAAPSEPAGGIPDETLVETAVELLRLAAQHYSNVMNGKATPDTGEAIRQAVVALR